MGSKKRRRAPAGPRPADISSSGEVLGWLEHMLAVPAATLRLAAKAVLARLACHLNYETCSIKVKFRTLAAETGSSPRHVRRLLSECESAGWLKVIHGRGQAANSYLLLVPNARSGAYRAPQNSGATVGHTKRRSGAQKPRSGALRVPTRTRTRSKEFVGEDGNWTSTKNQKFAEAVANPDAGFTQFWKHYPRKDGPEDARSAWKRARMRGASIEHLVAIAKRYATEEQDRNPIFTLTAKRWLDGGHYDNPPRPPSQAINKHNGTRHYGSRPSMQEPLLEAGGFDPVTGTFQDDEEVNHHDQ